ncbi:MAG: CPBP family intramembrane metalloprotease [Planctomycetes bacterium]|nr:CPBP family intramembrane metalloprotease [Planctomycetota bacterium]MCG2684697.1 CPBP family intramembrane metalloprotease [Planctomycetales bacterium]
MKHFPLMAAAFEGSLVALAIALGWLLGTSPLETFRFDPYDALLAIGATVPPLALFWLYIKFPLGPLKEIVRLMDETLVPLFRDCRLAQLAVIAALAGLGEEMLFRGVVQTAASEWIAGPCGPWIGLLAAAVLFGLLHTITPAYALLAGLIGLYLGWLWMATGNLLVPVIVHGLYDFLVLAYLVKIRPGKSLQGA